MATPPFTETTPQGVLIIIKGRNVQNIKKLNISACHQTRKTL